MKTQKLLCLCVSVYMCRCVHKCVLVQVRAFCLTYLSPYTLSFQTGLLTDPAHQFGKSMQSAGPRKPPVSISQTWSYRNRWQSSAFFKWMLWSELGSSDLCSKHSPDQASLKRLVSHAVYFLEGQLLLGIEPKASHWTYTLNVLYDWLT